MEYRGPIDEVVTDVSVELIAEPSQQLHPMVAAAIERAKSLAPVAGPTRPSAPPPRRKLNPDASLEFPHPLDPALYGVEPEGGELPRYEGPEAFDVDDDDLPPPRREVPRWRLFAVAGVMTVAAIIIGLALGSRASVTTASASEGDGTKTTTETPKKTAATNTTAAPPKSAEVIAPAAPTTGNVVTPKWAKGRHTFMDGKEIGLSGKLEVACGAHLVQIGVKGKPRKVKVPCGGDVNVLP